MRWRRTMALAGMAAATTLCPVWACGPFLYDNAELDQFSLLEPSILNNTEWSSFLSFSSPSFGQKPWAEGQIQNVIQPNRVSLTASQEVTNLATEYGAGEDPVSVTANEAWWKDYFLTVRHRGVGSQEVERLLYEGARPAWLNADDRAYLNLLDQAADDRQALVVALAKARDARLPEPLRHRYAFWAVRARALQGDSRAVGLFREFSPGPASDLPLARAQGWAASTLADTDPAAALALWLDLFVHWPELRAQTFSSLATLPSAVWKDQTSPEALVARFFLDGRDFSGETLGALAAAEKRTGGNGSWTESVFYAMAEQIERESGVFALFSLVDPDEAPPAGLFTALIDRAETLVAQGTQPATRTWWLVASYLCLFDGDSDRAAAFDGKAVALPALNASQAAQADLIAVLIGMKGELDKDWSPDLQRGVVKALDWGRTLNSPGHNRGLFHSVAVLAAQKYLARGRNPEAALAFGLVQSGEWSNPYRVAADDGFWATGWSTNNPVNMMLDALMSDEDLEVWKSLLRERRLDPLTARLTAQSFLTDRDLTWWQAHRALRRGQGALALALLQTLGGDGSSGSALFPKRRFRYSLDLDPLDPAAGRAMKAVSPVALATIMDRVETAARTTPSAKTLLAQGEFWFSLQLSGLPLLFSSPPPVISFVNGNFEYYGYDGKDVDRDAGIADFPLERSRAADWASRLDAFYQKEFTTLGRARRAFEAVLARRENKDAEYRALLFLQAIEGGRERDLGDARYDGLPLAEEFRSTCEWFT